MSMGKSLTIISKLSISRHVYHYFVYLNKQGVFGAKQIHSMTSLFHSKAKLPLGI